MERTERQKALENLIRQHPHWGYVRLNNNLKETTGRGYRKQALLDIKRKIARKSAPTPKAESRTKLIILFTTPKPNQLVRELRSLGFKDFEIAEVLAKKRKLKDGTYIDTTPPPPDGSTFENMIKARLELLIGVKRDEQGMVIAKAYQDNGWLKEEDSSMDFWKMFRRFFRDSDSPLITKSKMTGAITFSKGNVAEQKRRYRDRQRERRGAAPKERAIVSTHKFTTGKIAGYDADGRFVRYINN